jgi:hypothetical protein
MKKTKRSAASTANVQVSAISKPKAGRFEQGILDGCRDALLEMTCPVLGFEIAQLCQE